MTHEAVSLLSEVLLLPPADRAAVAAELLASLEPRDEAVEEAWAAEAVRRAGEVLDGAATSPWPEAIDRDRARLRTHC